MSEGDVLPKHVKAEYESKRKNLIMTLIIAYHNAGVEAEYLKKYDESEHHFSNGSEVGLKYFGKMDEMTRLLQKSLIQVKRVKAVQSVQKWNKGKKDSQGLKSPTEGLSMTSNNSRELKLAHNKMLGDSSSESKNFMQRTKNRSPPPILKPKNKVKSQERFRKITRRAGNMSVLK